jgi:hypothetical protein
VAPTSGAICLGIYFDIKIGTIQIPQTKLQEVLSLCKFYFSKSNITKKQLQALLVSLMFLHKAIKPARLFVNRILALLREMGEATSIAIDEASKQDLQWFIACAHAINGTVSIYKCLQPRLDIFVDASLNCVGGALHPFVYRHSLPTDLGGVLPIGRPSIFFISLKVFAEHIHGRQKWMLCDHSMCVCM